MTEDSWEHRMAARALVRQQVREAQESARRAEVEVRARAAIDKLTGHDEAWLNGWPRAGDGSIVLIGTSARCIGCGRDRGVTCVIFPEGWEPPGQLPAWPYQPDACPVCDT